MSEVVQSIKELLENFWEENALDFGDAGSVDDPLVAIDSMTCVEAICLIEDHFDVKITDDAFKPGGYHSKEEFFNDLAEITCNALEQKNDMVE